MDYHRILTGPIITGKSILVDVIENMMSDYIKPSIVIDGIDVPLEVMGTSDGGVPVSDVFSDGSIEKIVVWGVKGVPNFVSIVNMLKESTSIRKLVFENCVLGDGAIEALVGLIRESKSLETLRLPSCSIGDDDVAALVGALVGNTTLVELNLGNCVIGANGSRSVGIMLGTNGYLRRLVVFGSAGLNLEAIEGIAEGLKRNSTILELGLPMTDICDKGASALISALEGNTTITELGLGDVPPEVEKLLLSNEELARARRVKPSRPK